MGIEFAQFILFVAATLVLNLTPGPDMIFTAANGMQRGPKAGIISAAGIGLGGVFHATLAAIGVSTLIATTDWAFDCLRLVGAAYLIWIGIKSFRDGGGKLNTAAVQPVSYRTLFARGLLTNILNPKVALFFIAFLPQFINPQASNVPLQIFMLGMFVGISGIIINGSVGIFAGGTGRLFLQNPKSAKWISRISGCFLVGLGLRLLSMEKN